MYIDFHTHAFADKIAGRAMEALSATSGLKAVYGRNPVRS